MKKKQDSVFRFPKTPDITDTFKALSHPLRWKIMRLLEGNVRCNVGHIERETGMMQSAVSHHLGILRAAGLVSAEREGQQQVYAAVIGDGATLIVKS